MKFITGILIATCVCLTVCTVMVIGSITYKGNVELYLHEVFTPYDCNSRVPEGYQMLNNATEYTAKNEGYYLVYYDFYQIGFNPQSFSDSCKCKAFIRYHYDQNFKENNYKESFK